MNDIDRIFFEQTVKLLNERKYLRDAGEPLDCLSDADFQARFRLSKHSFREICSFLERQKGESGNRGLPITLTQLMCLTLRILATNAFFSLAADEFHVSKSTAWNVFNDVIESIFKLRNQFVYWPDQDEREAIAKRFYAKTGIPNIVGALDGSLVRITAPTEEEHVYVCRLVL